MAIYIHECRQSMKFLVYLFGVLSLFSTCEVFAQTFKAVKTEVVYPQAYSFFTGKGAGTIDFVDSLYGICFSQDTSDYAITTDGGTTWRDGRISSQLSPIRRMYITGRDTLVAIRDSNMIFHSYNGGETWSLVNSLWSGESLNNFLFFNSRYAVNIKGDGEFMISSDRGINWITTSWQFRKVKPTLFYNNGYLFAIETPQYAIPSKILYSTNNGYVWDSIVLPSTIHDYVWIARGSTGFILGTNHGIVYLISGQGTILKELTSPVQAYAGGYDYVNDSEIWCIALENGSFIKGLSLYSIANSTTSYLPITYYIRYAANIKVTTWDKIVIGSSGINWTSGILTLHRKGFQDVKIERYKIPGVSDAKALLFVNEAKGFVATSNNLILKTTDGGEKWVATSTPAQITAITGFAKRSESEFIALCEGGGVLESSDDGMTWNRIAPAFRRTIKKAAFSGRDTIFFCTSDSLYMTSPSWQNINPVNTGLPAGSFLDLNFYNGYNGSATFLPSGIFDGRTLVTTDGGATWQQQTHTGIPFTLDPGSHGAMFRSTLGFTTWYDGGPGLYLYVDAFPDLYDQNSTGNTVFTAAAKNIFFNLGKRGNYRHFNLEDNITRRDLVAAGADCAYLLSSGGFLYKISPSNGSPAPTSVLRTNPVDGSPYEFHNLTFKWQEPWSVAPITEYHFQLALGDTSNIVNDITGLDSTSVTVNLTADSATYFWRVRAANRYGWGRFDSWYRFKSSTVALEPVAYSTPLRGDLTAGIILPTGRLILSNNYGELARTDQLPGNWTQVASQTGYPIDRFIYDPNNNLTVYLTSGNFLGYSTNSGYTFSRKEAPLGSTMITGITPLPPNLLLASGYYGSIFKAVGGVSSWTNVWFAPIAGDFRHINTNGSDKMAAVGDKGNITLSTDGGQTYRYITHNQQEMYKRVSFASDGAIVVLNQFGERRISNDMGDTWTFEDFEISTPIRDMITQNGACAVIDTVGGIFSSPGPTSPWRYTKLPPGTSPMGVEISGTTIIVTARRNQFFYLPLFTGNPVGVEDAAPVTDFTLRTNYPNPFNPETVIRFALPAAGYAKGVVFDILGREVASLVDGEMPAGEHQLSFNGANLPSGVYIFRLESGKYSAAIKMLLTK